MFSVHVPLSVFLSDGSVDSSSKCSPFVLELSMLLADRTCNVDTGGIKSSKSCRQDSSAWFVPLSNRVSESAGLGESSRCSAWFSCTSVGGAEWLRTTTNMFMSGPDRSLSSVAPTFDFSEDKTNCSVQCCTAVAMHVIYKPHVHFLIYKTFLEVYYSSKNCNWTYYNLKTK